MKAFKSEYRSLDVSRSFPSRVDQRPFPLTPSVRTAAAAAERPEGA